MYFHILKSDLFQRAAEKLNIREPASLTIEGDSIVDKGSGKRLPLKNLGKSFTSEFRAFPPKTAGFPKNGQKSRFGTPEFISLRTYWAYAYGTQIAWVQVNEKTGEVKVLKVLSLGDAGRVLNPRAVEGQQEGGIAMGIGYALSEEFKVEHGINVTKSLKQCGLPMADDVPDIITRTVEVPHPSGPLGMKGVAETSSLATAPAVANAIFDAIGVRMKSLPMTKDKIKEALLDG
jgi:CO/xanthine dehydrogenase Mo-binding subunit